MIKQPGVCTDLISSTDLVPTLCDAIGMKTPANVDGVSFAAQLRGERPSPREWLYSWYSPRLNANSTVSEYAFDHSFKLYRTGEFYDLTRDAGEKNNIASKVLDEPAATARKKLERALDQFTHARPAELDRQFDESLKGRDSNGGKKKKKA